MALIKCNECGKSISDMAKICPACGYPIQKIKINESISENLITGKILDSYKIALSFLKIKFETKELQLDNRFFGQIVIYIFLSIFVSYAIGSLVYHELSETPFYYDFNINRNPYYYMYYFASIFFFTILFYSLTKKYSFFLSFTSMTFIFLISVLIAYIFSKTLLINFAQFFQILIFTIILHTLVYNQFEFSIKNILIFTIPILVFFNIFEIITCLLINENFKILSVLISFVVTNMQLYFSHKFINEKFIDK